MSSFPITNWIESEPYQFDPLTRVWPKVIKDGGFGGQAGVAEYSALPEGTSPADIAHVEWNVELFYVVSGEGLVYIEGEEELVPVKQGDCYPLPPVRPHLVFSTSPEEPIVVFYVEMTGPTSKTSTTVRRRNRSGSWSRRRTWSCATRSWPPCRRSWTTANTRRS